MPPSLAIYILVVGSLLSSLASFLVPNILDLEELSLTAPSYGSAVTTAKSSLTSLSEVTGYLVVVSYSDSLCKTPLSAVTRVLNSCYQIGAGAYQYNSATSSSYRIVEYTDSLCKSSSKTTSTSYTNGACAKQTKVSISSTSVWTPDIATVSVRWMNVRIPLILHTTLTGTSPL